MSRYDLFRFPKHKGKRRIAVLTAYDAMTAALAAESGCDMILVGDSAATVLLGYPSTAEVTMNEMVHHARAARRGAPYSFLIGDLPFEAVKSGPDFAAECAHRFIEESGCDAVKLEWRPDAEILAGRLAEEGIGVMGHVGLTPQRAEELGGLKVQGKEAAQAIEIYRAAKAFERAGAFAVVLECVPSAVAKQITRDLKIPTIGIGAGPSCDGQVLVLYDVIGLTPGFDARFVKRYANLHAAASRALARYVKDVRARKFPERRHEFPMAPAEEKRFRAGLGAKRAK